MSSWQRSHGRLALLVLLALIAAGVVAGAAALGGLGFSGGDHHASDVLGTSTEHTGGAAKGSGDEGGKGKAAGTAGAFGQSAPPAPRIVLHPASSTRSTTAVFAFVDGRPGVTYRCSLDGAPFEACLPLKTYTNLAEGQHVFRVEARSSAGTSAPASFSWLVDRSGPTVAFTQTPPNPDSSRSPAFTWTGDDHGGAGVAFYRCRLDGGALFVPCSSPRSLHNLGFGPHTFRVEATDRVGNTGPAAIYSWTISAAAAPLTISGDASGPLYPGATDPTPIPVTFTNPNGVAVSVTALSIVPTSLPSGCPAGDLTIDVGNISSSTPLSVPAGGSVTLPAQGVTEPTIHLDDNGDQDACSGSFTLSYGGSNTGSATFGPATPFTVLLGTPSGGQLLPAALGNPGAVVDTIQVTVTNNGPAAQNVHQIVYQITPGWTASLAGHPDCTAADFSIDGLAAGASHTVVYDNDLAPGAHVLHSFTIQWVDANHDQDACLGAHIGLTAVVS